MLRHLGYPELTFESGWRTAALITLRYLKTIPSYLHGSLLQTLATLETPREFSGQGRPVAVVPGAFCTSSVMNRLGQRLEQAGRWVLPAPNFPYYLSAMANLCPLDQAVDIYLNWLDGLADQGIERVDVVAHSNGGLIALLAQEQIDRGVAESRVSMERLVTMATPFGGFPGAKALGLFLPCCKDLIHDGEVLQRAAKAGRLVVHQLVSAGDSLIPPVNQVLSGKARTVMDDFQHMDFIVGAGDKIDRTAEAIIKWLPSD